MRRALTVLGLLGCFAATNYGAPRAPKTFGDWSAPVNVGPPLNTPYNDHYAVLSRDELTIYFTSDRPGSLGGDDLWFATRESVDSPWREPQNMRAPINTTFTDSLPFLSSNEHVLYFYSTRPAGSCGQGDIWMTRRQNMHSDWGEPTNLGCVLNTPADEIAPAFFEDPETEQAWLFYGRVTALAESATTMSMQAHWEKMACSVLECWFANSAARDAIPESS
jgi:WD40 repeat protein